MRKTWIRGIFNCRELFDCILVRINWGIAVKKPPQFGGRQMSGSVYYVNMPKTQSNLLRIWNSNIHLSLVGMAANWENPGIGLVEMYVRISRYYPFFGGGVNPLSWSWSWDGRWAWQKKVYALVGKGNLTCMKAEDYPGVVGGVVSKYGSWLSLLL